MFTHQDLQMFGIKLNTYLVIFQPLEVVGRGSETQLQVGEKLNKTLIKLKLDNLAGKWLRFLCEGERHILLK